jgi:hypothetical protein
LALHPFCIVDAVFMPRIHFVQLLLLLLLHLAAAAS